MSAPAVRRVVTGHDSEGRAVIISDKILGEPSGMGRQIWSTLTSPADNSDETDGGLVKVGPSVPGGTVFRVGEFEPGLRSPMHRTRSIDYGLVLRGTLGLELDSGEQVRLNAGDVFVQRGTNHVWFNDTEEPCVVAFILIDAEPVKIGDTVLETPPPSLPAPNGSR
ncbi:cupin domain-containing protein [Streptomyces sp. NPDC091280]|uniref:cupin domain-containing protein n=1 Tax=Streptomyces sp. NPDC091280 TaxID=3365984 RepID=UPI0037F6C5C9